MRTPIITLHNPWAFWVGLGWKTIETRWHDRLKSLKGRWIGIHAGLHWDKNALDVAGSFLSQPRINRTKKFLRVGGAIICVTFVEDARWLTSADSKRALVYCGQKRFGLVLSKITTIEAIGVPGHQGIWYHDIPDSVFEGITVCLRNA